MSSGQEAFAQEFQTALEEFRELRKQETRVAACGRSFVLVSNVTARLTQRSISCSDDYENDLDRLRQTAYLRHGPDPPQLQRDHYYEHLAVFYNLLDVGAPNLIHEFWNNNFNLLPIDRDKLRNHIRAPPGLPSFHDDFHRNQFAWCPIHFKMDMGGPHGLGIISPFSRKEIIMPYRGGKVPRANTATLYAIDVLEELVDPDLQKQMASAKIERQEGGACDGSKGKRYRFALKQFEAAKKDHFFNERQMFRNLKNQDGMIQYIGWFKGFEPDNEGGFKEYYNIVLELAAFDFYTAIQEESPPISVAEISDFWQAMSEISGALASIHTVEIDGREYLTWHGDIKPQNILRVNDRFKLADPGEASMQLKTTSITEPQKVKSAGGTRTYAAPEKAAFLDGFSQKKPDVSQTSDVWSLGCVFSIAATYVVLGQQGVLIFNQLRREAIFNATGHSSDAFHDGENVLKEVRYWHTYLREATRRTDAYTDTILNIVDNFMLVPGESRWPAKQIWKEFDGFFTTIKAERSAVPKGLHDLLQNIDLRSEQLYDQHSGIRRVDSDDTSKTPKVVPSLPRTDIEFESREKLLEQVIQPVAQRSQNRNGSPTQSRHPSISFHPALDTRTDGQKFPREVGKQNVTAQQLPKAPQKHAIDTPSTPDQPNLSLPPSNQSHDRNLITVWKVQRELEKNGLEWRPSIRSFRSLVQKQETTVRGKSNLELLDQRLETEFKDRDIIYLVDNGSTMSGHWTQASNLLKVLVWRSIGYDDNGMELYFTNPDTPANASITETKKQSVITFVTAMKNAEPSQSHHVKTTIVPELARIINGYTRAMTSQRPPRPPRKKTIIVLTDGIWEGMKMEHTIDIHLRSTFHELKDLHGDLSYVQPGKSDDQVDISEIRPVTIQFVQFGNHRNATERFRRLDDDMELYGCP
ncbi:protein kinase domain-containing protein [Colletotrichum scovillei]|uniref:Protein kinase domain-containing protein n=2 Tax=Colletotrichum scovillei TaxID=1209932 RepID=A0A9P7R4Q6_9PEZI|nr:protein kinase domain-containing protein [Colletotrichum scovillei]KAG7067364.1 protein kinase domain-containing protein [Colletotrichum scovillei]